MRGSFLKEFFRYRSRSFLILLHDERSAPDVGFDTLAPSRILSVLRPQDTTHDASERRRALDPTEHIRITLEHVEREKSGKRHEHHGEDIEHGEMREEGAEYPH
jgi:hypothetical protein